MRYWKKFAKFLNKVDLTDSLFSCTTKNTAKLRRIYMKKKKTNILSM